MLPLPPLKLWPLLEPFTFSSLTLPLPPKEKPPPIFFINREFILPKEGEYRLVPAKQIAGKETRDKRDKSGCQKGYLLRDSSPYFIIAPSLPELFSCVCKNDRGVLSQRRDTKQAAKPTSGQANKRAKRKRRNKNNQLCKLKKRERKTDIRSTPFYFFSSSIPFPLFLFSKR